MTGFQEPGKINGSKGQYLRYQDLEIEWPFEYRPYGSNYNNNYNELVKVEII